MSNLSDIKRRLTTVKQTRQITGAMQTVSVAKMRKATETAERSQAYLTLITDIMRTAVMSDCGIDAPTLGKDVLLVIFSDKGLCGGFNNAIFAAAKKMIADSTLIMPIGQTALNYFKGAGNVDYRFVKFGCADMSGAKEISDFLLNGYGNDIKSISVVYAAFDSQACPVSERLLPLELTKNDDGNNETMFEPSSKSVMDALVPLYLSGKIYGAICSSIAAEHSARHSAMSTATESADELILRLTSEYNRERQTAVTGQIVEIAGATSALSRKGAGSEKRF